jgi:hypothetical protein
VADTDVCKVSVVGIGMRSHAGVAAKMFKTLRDEGINIKVITTSEIKISVLIDRKYMELAVQALHDAFGLERAGNGRFIGKGARAHDGPVEARGLDETVPATRGRGTRAGGSAPNMTRFQKKLRVRPAVASAPSVDCTIKPARPVMLHRADHVQRALPIGCVIFRGPCPHRATTRTASWPATALATHRPAFRASPARCERFGILDVPACPAHGARRPVTVMTGLAAARKRRGLPTVPVAPKTMTVSGGSCPFDAIS